MDFPVKMRVNYDQIKLAKEVIFTRNSTKTIHAIMFFNNMPISKSISQKQLGLYLASILPFDMYTKTNLINLNKIIEMLRKSQQFLPLYKAFKRCHLYYGSVSFDHVFSYSICQGLESNNDTLAMVVPIRQISKGKLYQKLAFKSLQCKICFPKIFFTK